MTGRTATRAVVGASAAAALVVAAFLVPRSASPDWRGHLYAGAAPIFGRWDLHVGWGTPIALVLAIAVTIAGPRYARAIPWRALLAGTWATALVWSVSLALVDGWNAGFASRLTTSDEYLAEVGGVTDIRAMLAGFADRILDFQPDSWTTHVSGHPPGALLTFVLLDRLGLHGGAWAGALCVVVGTSAVVSILVTVRRLASEELARAAAPFLAIGPGAIWIAVSADGFFAGVAACALALLALSATTERWASAAYGLVAGLAFGYAIFLNYGLALLALPAGAVLLAARTVRPIVPVTVGGLAVVAAFAAAGFWWFDGYHLVVERYYQGIASERPFGYWGWANLAAVVAATGLAVWAAIPNVLSLQRIRAREGLTMLVLGALAAIVVADLSALSKAETERIWLPFTVWLVAAGALLPPKQIRVWLAVQAAGALLLVHTIFTNW